ncbi:MAG: protein translocase subunit SecF [Patescibacteria group bacterium]
MISFIKHRYISYNFSLTLIIISIVSLSLWGLKLGIDFTGGSLLQVEFPSGRPSNQELQEVLSPLNFGNLLIQPSGDSDVMVRLRDLNEDEHQQLLASLKAKYSDISEKRFESVGPTLGAELWRKALWAIGVALFFIIIYIAWAFRKVTRPVASWKYGLTAVIALAHNTVITVGIFSVLGHFWGVEVDSLFVSALLTLLGFSVHDTIVVYDRTRENIFRHSVESFADTVNKSLNDTLVRSINTGLATLLVLAALYFFGGESIHFFALALIIGIAIGTYSSIFVASPLLVDWFKLSQRK